VPRALDYLQASRRPDGRLARFYELKTNRPLYFTREYRLTYDDGDMPTHYAFAVGDDTASIRRQYEALRALTPAQRTASLLRPRARASSQLIQQVQEVLAAQDARGRWVEDGKLRYHGEADPTRRVIRCDTFIRHVRALCDYLEATAP
jgi:hypothetical protein